MTVKRFCFRLYLTAPTEHIFGLTRNTIIRSNMLQRKHPEDWSRLNYITGKLDEVVRSVQYFVNVRWTVPDSDQSTKKSLVMINSWFSVVLLSPR